MGFFADSVNRISPSQTIGMSTKARELKAQGRNIIDLSAGRAGSADARQRQGSRASRRSPTARPRYTDVDGIPELKAAIAAKFKRENELDYKPSQVSVGTGGKQVLFNALTVTLNPGDEVVIPAPCWVSYVDIVLLGRRQAGVRQLQVRGRLSPEARGARRGHHAQDQVVRVQRALQPLGRRLHQGAAQGADRRAHDAEEQARVGADRRHVRAPALRRPEVLHARRRSSLACTSARSP